LEQYAKFAGWSYTAVKALLCEGKVSQDSLHASALRSFRADDVPLHGHELTFPSIGVLHVGHERMPLVENIIPKRCVAVHDLDWSFE
jgi:hypothetical protein